MIEPLVSLLDAAGALKRLPRTGWLLAGVPHAESIADHSFAMTLLALALAEQINANPAAHGLAAPLDLARVLRLALLHDVAEAQVTDLPLAAATWLGRETKHRAEADAFAAITQGHPAAAAWRALHAEYAEGASPEARLVRDADKLEMAHQALVYRAAGHTRLGEFLAPPSFAYALSAALHTHLLARG